MAGENFWSNPAVEPKRAFRWQLYIKGLPTWIVSKVTKPSMEVTMSEHSYLNYQFKYPGRVKWNDVPVTLIDPLRPDAAKAMIEILTESGYVLPDQINQSNPTTISKEKAVAALGGLVKLQQIDPEGIPVETWDLRNAWIKDFKFGELDFESDELIKIDLILAYDWAEHNSTAQSARLSGV